MLRAMDSVAANTDSVRDFMGDVDRTLLRENLKLSFEERAQKHLRVLQMVEELRRAGKKLREKRMAVDLAHVIPLLVRSNVDWWNGGDSAWGCARHVRCRRCLLARLRQH